MPMVELTTTKGGLDDATKQRLAGELSTIALELEAAPFADFGDVPHMRRSRGASSTSRTCSSVASATPSRSTG
jgi:hypothetical protein